MMIMMKIMMTTMMMMMTMMAATSQVYSPLSLGPTLSILRLCPCLLNRWSRRTLLMIMIMLIMMLTMIIMLRIMIMMMIIRSSHLNVAGKDDPASLELNEIRVEG